MSDNHDETQTEITGTIGGDGQAPAEAEELAPEDRLGLQLHSAADQLVRDLQEVLDENPAGKTRQLLGNLVTNLAPLRDGLAEMLRGAGHLL